MPPSPRPIRPSFLDRRRRGRRSTAPTIGVFAFLLLAAGALEAQGLAAYDYEDLEFRAIGLDAGRIWPVRVAAATYYGLRMDLGFIGPRVRITPTARFWSSSLQEAELNRLSRQIVLVCERQVDVTCPERLDLGTVKLSDLELSADAQYVFFPERWFSPYLGAGLGLHLLNGRGDFIDDTFVEDLFDTVAPGVGPLLGVTLRPGSAIQLGFEARFMLASDIRYVSAGLTGVWTLPTPREAPTGSIVRGL